MGKRHSSLSLQEQNTENNLQKDTTNGSASRVIVSGVGLNHGIITEYDGKFSVETTAAGSGNLDVKIFGPKGRFKVDTFREHDWDRILSCRYYPNETGIYVINVMWDGTAVPGSPFKVCIAESEKMLKKMKKEAIK